MLGQLRGSVAALAVAVACTLLTPLLGQNVVATGFDLQGKEVNPLDLAAGKALVLIFERTDCPVCNRYAPTVNTMSQKYVKQAVFVMVYPDKSETPANIEKHQHDYGYTLTALRDPGHLLVKMCKVEITPEVAVFDAKRQLVYHGRIDDWYEDFGRARSAPTTHELKDAIIAAVKGGPAPPHEGAVGCYISDLQ